MAAQLDDPESMLTFYRRLIRLRAASRALQAGDYARLPSPAGTLCFTRQHEHSRVSVLLNFTDVTATVPVPVVSAVPTARLLLSTDYDRQPGDAELASVTLGSNEGLILDLS